MKRHIQTHSQQRTPLLVPKKEALSLLGGICMRTLERLIAQKHLPVRHIGRRTFIPYNALVAFTRGDHPTQMLEPAAESEAR